MFLHKKNDLVAVLLVRRAGLGYILQPRNYHD